MEAALVAHDAALWERSAIVDFLRKRAAAHRRETQETDYPGAKQALFGCDCFLKLAADAIERGEHNGS